MSLTVREKCRSVTQDLNAVLKAEITYEVESTSKNTGCSAVLADATIPGLGDPHPADSGSIVKSRKCTQRNANDNAFFFDVTVTYDSAPEYPTATTPSGSEPPGDRPADPTARNPSWKFGRRVVTVNQFTDLDGLPAENSKGQAFDSGIEIEVCVPVITIEHFTATFNPSDIVVYDNVVNSDTWFGLGVYAVKCLGVDIDYTFENNTPTVHKVWTLEVAPSVVPWEGVWHPTKVLDIGWSRDEFGGAGPQILLDGSGNELPEAADPVYLEFHTHRLVSFSGIPG